MKWFILVASILMKRLGGKSGEAINPINEFKDFLRENALKVLAGLIIVAGVGTMFSAGVVITTLTLTGQYDQGLFPRLTATTYGGLGMILISLVITVIVYYSSSRGSEEYDRRNRRKKVKENSKGSSIEDAVVLLINDFVRERESKREELKFRHDKMRSEFENEPKTESEMFERH